MRVQGLGCGVEGLGFKVVAPCDLLPGTRRPPDLAGTLPATCINHMKESKLSGIRTEAELEREEAELAPEFGQVTPWNQRR